MNLSLIAMPEFCAHGRVVWSPRRQVWVHDADGEQCPDYIHLSAPVEAALAQQAQCPTCAEGGNPPGEVCRNVWHDEQRWAQQAHCNEPQFCKECGPAFIAAQQPPRRMPDDEFEYREAAKQAQPEYYPCVCKREVCICKTEIVQQAQPCNPDAPCNCFLPNGGHIETCWKRTTQQAQPPAMTCPVCKSIVPIIHACIGTNAQQAQCPHGASWGCYCPKCESEEIEPPQQAHPLTDEIIEAEANRNTDGGVLNWDFVKGAKWARDRGQQAQPAMPTREIEALRMPSRPSGDSYSTPWNAALDAVLALLAPKPLERQAMESLACERCDALGPCEHDAPKGTT